MKAVRLYSLDDIRVEETAIPVIAPDEALVRMKACGICGSDTMDWYVAKKAPFCPGHEPAGVIEEVGRNVSDFGSGDRVFVHHHAPCFHCRFCHRQQYSLCLTWKASNIDPGGLAEFFRVPATNLRGDTHRIPDAFSFEDASLIEPTACVVKSLRKGGLTKEDSILILGLGVMGQMHILLARHYGVRTIIAADYVPYRLQKGIEFGADCVVDAKEEDLVARVEEQTDGRLANLVIVGPGSVEAMKTGLSCVGKGGRVLFFTPSPDKDLLQINPFHLYFSEIDLTFSYSCGPNDTRESIDLIDREVVSANKLVTHRYPILESREAVSNTIRAENSLKTVVVN